MDRRGAHGPGIREVRTRGDHRKEGEAMARSEIRQKFEDLSGEREGLLARERSRRAGPGGHRRLAEIDNHLGVLWDLRRRELAGGHVGREEGRVRDTTSRRNPQGAGYG